MHHPKGLGPLFLLGTYGFWGGHAVVISATGMGAAASFWLSLLSVILFGLVLAVMRLPISFKDSKHLIRVSVVRTAQLLFAYGSLKLFDPAIAMTFISGSSLVMVCLLAPRRDEKVKIEVALLSLLGVVGIFFVSRENLSEDLFTLDPLLIVPIIAMFVIAYGLFTWRDSSSKVHPATNLFYLHFWTAIFSGPVLLIASPLLDIDLKLNTDIGLLILFIGLAAAGDLLFVIGQKFTSVTLVGVMNPLVAVFTAIFSSVFLSQTLQWWQWLGTILVVASAAIAILITNKKPIAEILEEPTQT